VYGPLIVYILLSSMHCIFVNALKSISSILSSKWNLTPASSKGYHLKDVSRKYVWQKATYRLMKEMGKYSAW